MLSAETLRNPSFSQQIGYFVSSSYNLPPDILRIFIGLELMNLLSAATRKFFHLKKLAGRLALPNKTLAS